MTPSDIILGADMRAASMGKPLAYKPLIYRSLQTRSTEPSNVTIETLFSHWSVGITDLEHRTVDVQANCRNKPRLVLLNVDGPSPRFVAGFTTIEPGLNADDLLTGKDPAELTSTRVLAFGQGSVKSLETNMACGISPTTCLKFASSAAAIWLLVSTRSCKLL